MSAEEFSRLPGHERYELVAGRLQVSEPPGGLHGVVAVRLASVLHNWVDAHDLGTVLVETGYIVRHSPDTVRGPDVSFVSKERLGSGEFPQAFVGFAPDLAVEILSPDDRSTEIEEKVADYLRGGTRLVWVVDPVAGTVSVRRPGQPPESLDRSGRLDGGEVVPGFSCSVQQLLPRRNTKH
jgi:Uma2 family endonuclease